MFYTIILLCVNKEYYIYHHDRVSLYKYDLHFKDDLVCSKYD